MVASIRTRLSSARILAGLALSAIQLPAIAVTFSMGASIPVGSSPGFSATRPGGQEVFVANASSNTVSVISTATDAVVSTIAVGSGPNRIVFSRDGSQAYVGQDGGGVTIIDANTRTTRSAQVGAPVRDIALSSSGSALYLAMEFSGLRRLDLISGAVSVANSAVCPESVVTTPDARRWVNYQCAPVPGSGGHDPIYVFAPGDETLEARVAFLPDGRRMANVGRTMEASPDGSQIWANGGDACSSPGYDRIGCPLPGGGVINIVRTSDRSVVRSLGIGGGAGAISFTPDSLYALVGGATLRIFDTQSFAELEAVPLAASGSVAFSVDGLKAYAPVPGQNIVRVLQRTDAVAWRRLSASGSSPPTGGYVNHTFYSESSNRLLTFVPGHNATGNAVWILTNANGAGGAAIWSRLATIGAAPQVNALPGVTYDTASDRLFVYGGCFANCSPALTDVFVLSNASGVSGPSEWRKLAVSNPQARDGHTVAYDPASKRLISFGGGLAFFGTDQNDLRVLSNADGSAGPSVWQTPTTAGGPPSIREVHTTIFDPSVNRMVLFGGWELARTCCPYDIMNLGDTWRLDAASAVAATPTWTRVATSGPSPSPRGYHAAAFDAGNDRMFVYGGSQWSNSAQDTTLLDDLWQLVHATGRADSSTWRRYAQTGELPGRQYVHGLAFDRTTRRLLLLDSQSRVWIGDVPDGTTNGAPTASVGGNRTVALGSMVALDGSSSSDPDGDAISFAWTFVTRPSASRATLVDANTARPAFQADQGGIYVIRLSVSDGRGGTGSADVTVTTGNQPPVAIAGPATSVRQNASLALDGTASYDPDGDPITYRWTAISFPSGATPQLTGASTARPIFSADLPGAYVVQLAVSDGRISIHPSPSARVTITVTSDSNRPPVANAGFDQAGSVGAAITLDGSRSYDPDGDVIMEFGWSFLSTPSGSAVTLTRTGPANGSIVTMRGNRAGDYVIRLTVISRGDLLSSDDVIVRLGATPPQPPDPNNCSAPPTCQFELTSSGSFYACGGKQITQISRAGAAIAAFRQHGAAAVWQVREGTPQVTSVTYFANNTCTGSESTIRQITHTALPVISGFVSAPMVYGRTAVWGFDRFVTNGAPGSDGVAYFANNIDTGDHSTYRPFTNETVFFEVISPPTISSGNAVWTVDDRSSPFSVPRKYMWRCVKGSSSPQIIVATGPGLPAVSNFMVTGSVVTWTSCPATGGCSPLVYTMRPVCAAL